ncbi:efflux RND transporter periplasmic adaptor subunit [Desulfitobacterium sp. PCE1]|uniref:efflux RND transporter periplasmic adaptor subunit n=1 Tax=Desulfitobacterium sp. PCE1 TaxID=146907 RepID=UPI0003729B5C|nr:efflux RND transporter periplasmic adaptor subunit [Desulfitobacterium sp. PCE1]
MGVQLKSEEQQQLKEKVKGKKSRKGIVLAILTVIVLVAGCAGFYYFNENSRYFTTDNAKVTAKMYTITPNASGELLEWKVKEGDQVEKNQVLGRQAVLPYITSPIQGTVIKNNTIQGQAVTPASQLAVITDTDNLYIGVNIEETDIVKIKVGQRVDVKLDAYPGVTFPGMVQEIDRATQTYFSGTSSFSTSGTYSKVTQLIPVKVVIENKDNLPLTFGMNATVKIHIKEEPVNTPVGDQGGETSDSQQAIHYSSVIEAADQMGVIPNVSGKVSKINVSIGQRVEKGDVLFQLDSTDLELQVKQATASYNAAVTSYNHNKASYDSQAAITPAQIAYNEAMDNYTRIKALYDGGAVSEVELNNAQDKVEITHAQLQTAQNSAKGAVDAAAAQMASAQAGLDIAQKKLDDCIVRAPMAGEVAAKTIEVGMMASPQAAAMTLIDTQEVKVSINVTETNISQIKVGSAAEVKVQAINAAAQGKVVNIAPASDAKTGMFQIEILLENPDSLLKAGMICDVELM